MKIVFFAHFAGSPEHGMVYGHYYLAREWVRMGHEVTIVAASYAHTRFRQPTVTGAVSEKFIDGIRYLWVSCPEYAPSGQVGRVKNILTFVARTFGDRLPITDADVVISSSHYPFAIFPARKWAKRFGARLVFEVRDIWPLTLIELGGASSTHPFIRLMQWSEDYAYRVADKVVSVLPHADRHMLAHGMRAEKFLYIPNGADLECKDRQPLPADYLATIRQLKEDGHFLLGYAGRMGLANAMHHLLKALALPGGKRVHALLLGEGYELENLKRQAEELGLQDRVHFLPFVPKAQVESFLLEMDALYVGFLKQPLYRFGTSVTKMNDYMLAAKPIICAIDAEVEGVEEAGAGIICPAEESQAIAAAIDRMSQLTDEERHRMGQAGRNWVVAHRDYRVLAERFLAGVGEEPS
ncbi:Glycosyltransferase involved in cell wall bisynthesis [Malonomonas rubra DSM 5091]|uniref:Glycosyltransferase involved in cell wall bisynthesis n=1 Tax=Malonomonas rubra DSM 5091 TaxID=1122189 RepID=A0A1M6DRA6_MALRU|nr:glycosyltransferase family 4 protein [Malonomonas rubra]SHI75659.1 Glycosyltransferase involved in cell wall bisynthesis [Malonomonas rubra DSM 5091]